MFAYLISILLFFINNVCINIQNSNFTYRKIAHNRKLAVVARSELLIGHRRCSNL